MNSVTEVGALYGRLSCGWLGVVDGLALHGQQTIAASTGRFHWRRSSTEYTGCTRIKVFITAWSGFLGFSRPFVTKSGHTTITAMFLNLYRLETLNKASRQFIALHTTIGRDPANHALSTLDATHLLHYSL